MPSIEENKQLWDRDYRWTQGGDEWSVDWGTAHAQWVGCLLPRVFPFLQGRILEIAPGYGRWTQFLAAHCVSLIGIDLAQSSIERCSERFKDYPNLEFKVNDGLTYPMVEDASIDFAFSFDSLVHAEADVISSYVNELRRVLKPGGVAFLHHSNVEDVSRRFGWYVLGRRIKGRITGTPYTDHWRGGSMSADKMREFVERSGMSCLQQEIVPWGASWPLLIDCMSTIINRPGQQCHIVKNPRFMKEAAVIKRISSLE